MTRFHTLTLSVLLVSGCSLTPDKIAEGIAECETFGLVPLVVISRWERVRKVTCTVPDDQGYTRVQRGISLPKLPSLPSRP